jgi:hypothetical protein
MVLVMQVGDRETGLFHTQYDALLNSTVLKKEEYSQCMFHVSRGNVQVHCEDRDTKICNDLASRRVGWDL